MLTSLKQSSKLTLHSHPHMPKPFKIQRNTLPKNQPLWLLKEPKFPKWSPIVKTLNQLTNKSTKSKTHVLSHMYTTHVA